MGCQIRMKRRHNRMESTMIKAGKFLKTQRIKAGMTIGEASAMTGGNVNKTSLCRIERGERSISLKVAYYLSKLYGVDMEKIAEKECGKAKIKTRKTAKKKEARKKAKKNPVRKKRK